MAQATKKDLEIIFEAMLRHYGVRPQPEREYRFHPPRRWRFDFAWPAHKFAVEIDGLVYGGKGGHQTVDGVVADCEKYEAAMLDGWTVYRVPGPWVRDWREEMIGAVRLMLRHSGK